MGSIPDSWLKQKLEFSEDCPLGLIQYKNGPCGVLSVIQATIISQCLEKEGFSAKYQVTDQDIVLALTTIVSLVCKPDVKVSMAQWKE